MSKKIWLEQGRTQEYADDRIRRKLKARGCLNDSKTEVFRLNNGERVYRCPRSTCDETDSLSHYSQYSAITNGGFTYDYDSKPWKFHQIMRRVKNEISEVRRLEAKNNAPKKGAK